MWPTPPERKALIWWFPVRTLRGRSFLVPYFPSSVFEASVKHRKFPRRSSILSLATSMLKRSPLPKERFDLSNFGSFSLRRAISSILSLFDLIWKSSTKFLGMSAAIVPNGVSCFFFFFATPYIYSQTATRISMQITPNHNQSYNRAASRRRLKHTIHPHQAHTSIHDQNSSGNKNHQMSRHWHAPPKRTISRRCRPKFNVLPWKLLPMLPTMLALLLPLGLCVPEISNYRPRSAMRLPQYYKIL